jgi:cytidine deaminase
VALGRAIMEGDGRIAVIAALRAPKPGEAGREPALVAPCGACREMIFDFDPEALVILPHPEHGAVKLPIRALLPVPYPRFPAAGPD